MIKRISGALVVTVLAVGNVFGGEIIQAPDLALMDLKEQKARIDYKSGKLTLVNFWATWCLPCREEIPQIARLVDTYGKQGLRAVGIALESGAPAEVRRFLQANPELKPNYPILIGDDQTGAKFGNVEVVPTTYLIDPAGKVIKSYIGINPDFFRKVGADVKKSLAPDPDGKR